MNEEKAIKAVLQAYSDFIKKQLGSNFDPNEMFSQLAHDLVLNATASQVAAAILAGQKTMKIGQVLARVDRN